LMHKQSPPTEPVLIDPSEVMARASTDVLHVADPVVKGAIHFMQQNFHKSFTMDTVAETVRVSRRSLETSFRIERNTSPAVFLVNLRLKKAKDMLASRDQKSVEEIARACGFGTRKNMRAAFRRVLDASPKDFTQNPISD